MFEAAEIGHEITKERYEEETTKLRQELLGLQYALLDKKSFATAIVLAGVDGAGKSETANKLHEWLDPRHVETHAADVATVEEAERPEFFRYWQGVPPKGKLGIYIGGWYTLPLYDRFYGRTRNAEFERSLQRAQQFEQMLVSENVVVLKIWLHLSKAAQKKRLKALEENEATRWRVRKEDWERHARHATFVKLAERVVRATSTGQAPWLVIEATDERYRNLTVLRALCETMRARLAAETTATAAPAAPPPRERPVDDKGLIESLDLSKSLSKHDYEERLDALQGKLGRITRLPRFKKHSVVAVFEGADAAGKGGAIRRVCASLDARQYRVIPIAAPTDEEKARPYLWRFWRQLPRKGKMTIFDRSWYGRVLVERVEGFCSPEDWKRAYGEINAFEEELERSGCAVVKFWLQISQDEQLERFEARQATPFKRYKIGEEDWRNRKKWDLYRDAVNEMIERTSTDYAPWTLVEANDKRYARVKILETLCSEIERVL